MERMVVSHDWTRQTKHHSIGAVGESKPKVLERCHAASVRVCKTIKLAWDFRKFTRFRTCAYLPCSLGAFS